MKAPVFLFGLSAAAILIGAPARAEFSEEWEDYAAETRAVCDAFEAGLTPRERARPVQTDRGDGYAWPRGTPGRPHVCLYYTFDVGADGAPANIELLFKGPENLHFRFVRAGKLQIQSRRYHPWDEPLGGDRSVVTKITIVAQPDWRFTYWIEDL